MAAPIAVYLSSQCWFPLYVDIVPGSKASALLLAVSAAAKLFVKSGASPTVLSDGWSAAMANDGTPRNPSLPYLAEREKGFILMSS